MSKTYAHYTESTKRNVVAAVRSGLSIRGMGKRLSIHESIISQWVHSPRYSDVAPASEDVLAAIPSLPCPENDSQSGFVKVRKGCGTGLRITMGKLCFESDSFTPEVIRMIMEAAGVLVRIRKKGTEVKTSGLQHFIQLLSALPAAGVLILPRSDVVPCAVHPDGVFAEPGYLGNAGEAVPVFPQSFYPLSFSCHNDVLLKTYEGMALHFSKEFRDRKFRGNMEKSCFRTGNILLFNTIPHAVRNILNEKKNNNCSHCGFFDAVHGMQSRDSGPIPQSQLYRN